jgi:hypothetical protein
VVSEVSSVESHLVPRLYATPVFPPIEPFKYQALSSRSVAKFHQLRYYPGPYAADSISSLFPRQSATDGGVQLDFSCAVALNWPLETLENTKREDIVLINFHLWVLGISVAALLNESSVHM